jgi:hypothetical protein
MTKQFLKPGSYMKISSVIRFLAKYNPIKEMEANKLTKHKGEFDVYFSTADLKSIMNIDLFREMECECITHLILEK